MNLNLVIYYSADIKSTSSEKVFIEKWEIQFCIKVDGLIFAPSACGKLSRHTVYVQSLHSSTVYIEIIHTKLTHMLFLTIFIQHRCVAYN